MEIKLERLIAGKEGAAQGESKFNN